MVRFAEEHNHKTGEVDQCGAVGGVGVSSVATHRCQSSGRCHPPAASLGTINYLSLLIGSLHGKPCRNVMLLPTLYCSTYVYEYIFFSSCLFNGHLSTVYCCSACFLQPVYISVMPVLTYTLLHTTKQPFDCVKYKRQPSMLH